MANQQNPSEDGIERRRGPRPIVSIRASIAFNGGRSKIDCIIRNISVGGAKLEVASVTDIPNTFDLLVPGRPPHPCRVQWRAMKELGVSFPRGPIKGLPS